MLKLTHYRLASWVDILKTFFVRFASPDGGFGERNETAVGLYGGSMGKASRRKRARKLVEVPITLNCVPLSIRFKYEEAE
jgi:hypothetical protein